MTIVSIKVLNCDKRVNHLGWPALMCNMGVIVATMLVLQNMRFHQHTGVGDLVTCFGGKLLKVIQGMGQGSRNVPPLSIPTDFSGYKLLQKTWIWSSHWRSKARYI